MFKDIKKKAHCLKNNIPKKKNKKKRKKKKTITKKQKQKPIHLMQD